MDFARITDLNKIEVIHITTNDKISVQDDLGNDYPIKIKTPTTDGILLHFSSELNLSRNYIISCGATKVYARLSTKMLNKYFYYSNRLGPKIEKDEFSLRVWSPTATKIMVHFFTPNKSETATKAMKRKKQGVWHLRINLNDIGSTDFYYQLQVCAFGKTNLALDPYAKSMEAFSSQETPYPKAAWVDPKKASPSGFSKDSRIKFPPMSMIGYEVHVRDFTIDRSSDAPDELKGTYLGFTHQINHLKELGITHVQLLPVQSFFTVDETQRDYQDNQTPREQINYNWGYDAHHYFIPQGWYSTSPTNPTSRIIELKNLVMALHASNIGVIMDVVYNHIYHESFLENVAPGCYMRHNKNGKISGGTGAGASLESRNLMTRKLIIDSLKYFKDEFHIDGFRFDLMGFHDKETMIAIREALGKDSILYGEAWEFTDLPFEQATTKNNLPTKARLAAFNDSARNSYTGEMSKSGFVQGSFQWGPIVRSGIIGGIKNYKTDYDGDGHLSTFIDEYKYHCFADDPFNSINFLSIHDGFTLWDKINLSRDCDEVLLKKMIKMSFAMLFTSQGRIVLHGGDEIGRSKPFAANDPNSHRAHGSSHADGRFHENSYRSCDYTNRFEWKKARKNRDLFNYVKGLIEIRKKYSCFHFASKDEVNDGVHFFNENIPNNAKYVTRKNTRHTNWDEMPFLTIEFINGPANSSLYLIGEIHGDQTHSKNPKNNPYYIDFDSDGRGEITFKRKEIDNFDFQGWGTRNTLNIKLVKTPGEWDYCHNMYTRLGNNSITPQAVKRKKCMATINLAKLNHAAGSDELHHQGYIAYFIKAKSKSPYSHFLIIHNANEGYLDMPINQLVKYKTLDILADGNYAGLKPIISSTTEIYQNRIKIPSKSSTIIGCK